MPGRAVTYFRLPRGPAAAERLREQRSAVQALVRRRRLAVLEPFVESPRPGGALPELEAALAQCRESRAVLLLAELAPRSRDVRFLETLLAARVRVAAADLPRAGRRTLELLLEVATPARETASRRARQALAAARERGVRIGSPRPEIGARAGAAALREAAGTRAEALRPTLEEIRLSNPEASLRETAAVLNAYGIEGARGGAWGPSAVRNLVRRLERSYRP